MIYLFTEGKINLREVQVEPVLEISKLLSSDAVDPKGKIWFNLQAPSKFFLDGDKVVEPSPGDVIISEEGKYGVGETLKFDKSICSVLIFKLREEYFAKPREVRIPRK